MFFVIDAAIDCAVNIENRFANGLLGTIAVLSLDPSSADDATEDEGSC